MSVSVLKQLKPHRLRRFGDIAGLFAKYGRVDFLRQAGIEFTEESSTSPTRGKAEDLPADLERLGPTFVKLGQLLSTRSDLLPIEYIEALIRLQDRVEPGRDDQECRRDLEGDRGGDGTGVDFRRGRFRHSGLTQGELTPAD